MLLTPRHKSSRRGGCGAALLCALALSLLPRAARSQRVYASTYAMRMSETAPGNLLPSFRFMLGQVEGGSEHVAIGGGSIDPAPFVPGDSCPEQIFDHASADLHAPNLPYLTQDLWDCARVPTNVSVLAYEDAHLRLSITPQFNGRMFVPKAPATTARAHLRRSARRRPANPRRRRAAAAPPCAAQLVRLRQGSQPRLDVRQPGASTCQHCRAQELVLRWDRMELVARHHRAQRLRRVARVRRRAQHGARACRASVGVRQAQLQRVPGRHSSAGRRAGEFVESSPAPVSPR